MQFIGSISPGWSVGRKQPRRPPSGTTYSRPRKKLSAGRCRCPHRQGQCSCRPHSNSTPGVSGWPPVSFAPVSCGKGNRPACVPAAASLYRGYLSCVPSILLSVAVPPKRFPAPFLRRVPALARSPYFGTFCPEVRLLAVLPQPGYSFSDGHSVFKVLSIDELS